MNSQLTSLEMGEFQDKERSIDNKTRECSVSGPTNHVYHRAIIPSERGNGMAESLLTAKQVAEYLKIDKFTVYRLVAQRKLPAYKVGSQWSFNKKLLERWLRQNLNVPSSPKSQ